MSPDGVASRGFARVGPIAALLAFGLSASVVAGWATGNPWLMFRPLYAGPPMYLHVALATAVAGLCLALLRRCRGTHAAALMLQITATLVAMLGFGFTLEVLLGFDLGLDLRALHATADMASHVPGRPSPNAAVALLSLGLGMLFLGMPQRPAVRLAATAAAGVTGLIGLFGTLVYALHLGFFNLWLQQTSIAAPTSMVFLLLGVALLAELAHDSAGRTKTLSDFQRIAVRSTWVLVIVSLSIGLGGLAVMQLQIQGDQERVMRAASQLRARGVQAELDGAYAHAQARAAHLRDVHAAMHGVAGVAEGLREHAAEWQDYDALRLLAPDGRTLVETAPFAHGPALRLSAPPPAQAAIRLGAAGYLLQIRVPLDSGGRALGTLEFEQKLQATRVLMALRLPWRGAVIALCGRDGRQPVCMHTADDGWIAPLPAEPARRLAAEFERAGADAVIVGSDGHARPALVVAQPVGSGALQLGIAVPAIEIYAPLRAGLQRMWGLMLLAGGLGAVFMYRSLRPLTQRLAEAMRESRENHEHFVAAADSARDALSILAAVRDDDGNLIDLRIVFANAAAAAAAGTTPRALIGTTVRATPGPDTEAYFRECVRVIETGVPATFVSDATQPSGRRVVRHLTRSHDGVFEVGRDVTDDYARIETLTTLAMTDALTGLPNRRALQQRLAGACERAARDGRCVALAYCDLDDFKGVNDRLGHACGDELLVAVARALQSAVRRSDMVARLSGDEFVVLLEALDNPDEARTAIDSLRTVTERPVTLAARTAYSPRVSIGYTVACGATARPHELLAEADTAMYREKTRRKNPALTAPDA